MKRNKSFKVTVHKLTREEREDRERKDRMRKVSEQNCMLDILSATRAWERNEQTTNECIMEIYDILESYCNYH